MTAAESEVKRLRDQLTRLRGQAAQESAKIGPARERSAKARAAAAKATSPSLRKMREAEADREEQKATDAEKKRATLETQAAKVEADLYRALARVDQERARLDRQRADAQRRALARLGADARNRDQQFEPARSTAPIRAQAPHPAQVEDTPAKDVFISHASEDKDEIARPLAEALLARGVTVWFDELDIRVGMSIRRAIERGIANCRFGVVILSQNFFKKRWTQAELDGLYGRQMTAAASDGFILPIWHKVSRDEVQANVSMLAGIFALNTMAYSIADLADELTKVVLVGRDAAVTGNGADRVTS